MKTLKFSSLIILLAAIFFSCQKEYSLEGIVTPAGTWQFNDAATVYAGNMDSANIETTGTTKTLNLVGKSSDGKQNFLMHLYATDSFTVGTYKASLFQSDFQYYTQAKTIYNADQFVGEFIVTVTAIGNNSITGIFSGASEDSTGAPKPLTLGKFTSRINLSTNGTGGGSGGNTAVGTLGAAAGVCTPLAPNGTYTQGIALTSTNTVTVTVTVTTPGTYTISTNTVNGVSFSKTGTFTNTGVQTVILNGSGTPVASGNQTFTVTFGTGNCTFVVNFLPGTPPPATDYFPTTTGSFWAYGNANADPADSFLIAATARTKLVGSVSYNVFTYDDIPSSGSPSDLYYRKSGGDYFEYFNAEDFFGFFDPGSTSPANIEYTFLKESANVNDTWQSTSVTGTSGGLSVTIYMKMTLLAKAVSATSGIITSPDVMKVKYEYYATSPGFPATVIFVEERWFARGKGMIYNSFDDQSGSPPAVYKVGRYLVL